MKSSRPKRESSRKDPNLSDSLYGDPPVEAIKEVSQARFNNKQTKRKITIIKEVDPSLKPEIVYDGKDVRMVLLPKGIRAWCHLCPNGGKGFFTLIECLQHMKDGHRVWKG